jgi:hypothetical protein
MPARQPWLSTCKYSRAREGCGVYDPMFVGSFPPKSVVKVFKFLPVLRYRMCAAVQTHQTNEELQDSQWTAMIVTLNMC